MSASDFFRKIPLFTELRDDDLDRLCRLAEEMVLEVGDVLFEEGSQGDRAYVIEEGALEVFKMSNQREVLLAVLGPGQVLGEMALLEDRPRNATARAQERSRLWTIDQMQLQQLMNRSASAAASMFYTMLARWRKIESQLRQSEKMVQLGTLTAGVAHELNNPAAAVERGAVQLESVTADMAATLVHLSQMELTPEQHEVLDQLASRVRQEANDPGYLDAIARSDLEDTLEQWLDSRQVEDSWELAPTMVSLRLSDQELDTLSAAFTRRQLQAVIRWLNANYDTYNLLAELRQGAKRITTIVKALKSYSYLDQAPVQKVDIHQGLNDTLLILRHKLRQGIEVTRDYDPDLPLLEGHGSELNQVWTNLIDNAADAILMGHPDSGGQIIVRTRVGTPPDDGWIVVTIEDNGPGISEEARDRLFEPFFTTKPPGAGTGLGLDISYNIVVNKHRGEIKVDSKPGMTLFEVWLPVNFERQAATTLREGKPTSA